MIYVDHLHVYTNASKDTKGKVRAAFCDPQLNVKQYAHVTDNVTIYAAEMSALKWQ